jgi:hypothetical protein
MMSASRADPEMGRRLGSAILSVAGIAFLVAGCSPQGEITRTTEPHVEYRKPKAPGEETPATQMRPTRILGAIAPEGDGQSWFFKLMGPAEEVGKQEKAFDAFLASLRFDAKQPKPVTWTLPEGWREGPRKGRYATLLMGEGKEPLELTVLLLGGDLLENVNRWRGHVHLDAVKADALPTMTREVTAKDGRKMTRVDLSGMAPEGPPVPPFMKK